jgi:hypothetical protein
MPPYLMDGGANICIPGDLTSMENVTDIQAFPLSVATTTGTPTIMYCCTKKGYIRLPLIDGDT